MGGILSRLDDYIVRLTALDDDQVTEFLNREYGFLHKMAGTYSELKTPKDRWLTFLRLFFVSTSILYCQTFISITAYKAYNWRVNLSFHMIFTLITSTLVHVFLYIPLIHRPEMNNAIMRLNNGFFQYSLEVSGKHQRVKRAYRWARKNFIFTLFAMIASASMPYVVFRPNTNERFVNDLDLSTIFMMYVPFPGDSWTMYILLNLLMIVSYGYVITICYFSTLVTFDLYSYWLIEMQRLIDSVGKLEERAVNQFSKTYHLYLTQEDLMELKTDKSKMYRNEVFIDSYLFCLRENILHHYAINSYLQDIQRLLNLPMFLFVILGSAMLALNISAFVGELELGAVVHSVISIADLICLIFIMCFVGQRIVDMPEELREAVYGTEWILCPRIVTINIMIIMEAMRQPIKPQLMKFFNHDYHGFVFMFNTAFTYYNILLMSRGMEIDVL